MIKKNKNRIILASSSPRRKYLLNVLLGNFGLNFVIIPANIIEYISKNSHNYAVIVKKFAKEKALQVAKKHKGIIIGADTIVVIDHKILGKPTSIRDAVRMLNILSGKWHKVYTGIAIVDTSNNNSFTDYQVTKVKFRELDKSEINSYTKSGAAMDKAGAYGIQDDFSCTFAEKISGDYFNIVGLPVLKTYLGLKEVVKDFKLIVS